MGERESWATGTMGQILQSYQYGTAESMVEDLAAEEEDFPLSELAARLRAWAYEHLLNVVCTERDCLCEFSLSGAHDEVMRSFLKDVDWRAVANSYEDDCIREGGTKQGVGLWTWEEADGGECDA